MQVFLLLQLLILLMVANGAAVATKKLLGATFARPLDGGAPFVDGRPILGPAKTIRGIVASVVATSICASLMDLGWKIGTLIAAFTVSTIIYGKRVFAGGVLVFVGLAVVWEDYIAPLLRRKFS